jgi:hypothetical protein
MRLVTFLATALIVTPLAAQANPGSVANLGVLTKLVGEWDGEAWTQRAEGRFSVRQQEWVALEAGGTVLAVRGIGTLTQDGQSRVVHHAFAVIHQNHEKTGIMMRAFTAEGHWLDPQIQLTETGYTWTMNDPRIGDIRYVMVIDDQGRWVEDGFFSRDQGKTWTQFMGMVLTKKR